MTDPITRQQTIDAAADAALLANVVNGSATETFLTRLGRTVKSVAKTLADMEALTQTPLPTIATSFIDFTVPNNGVYVIPQRTTPYSRMFLSSMAPNNSNRLHHIAGDYVIDSGPSSPAVTVAFAGHLNLMVGGVGTPTGTTGAVGTVGVYCNGDKNIRVENRTGVNNLSLRAVFI